MAEIAQRHQDELPRIKKNVEKSYDYFRENCKRWHEWKKFLYVTSLTEEDIAVLRDLGKPELEFNILEAYVARQKGEFSKQEPSIKVGPGGLGQVDSNTIDIIEGHIRNIEKESRDDNTAYEVYDDMLAGGFSAVKVFTDYSTEMSFDQEIKVRRAFDPTLCGFDPLAVTSHKGDGEYCFELYVLREKEFNEMYPNISTAQMKFSTNLENFNWTYKTNQEKIVLVADYYEKKKKKIKIVKLTNGRVMTVKDYEEFLLNWEMSGNIEQPPQLVGEPRSTTKTTVVRYRFIEDKVLDYKETCYSYLPIVFFDGDSVMLRMTESGPLQQITRPYCYQAQGVQKLKNYAGQTLANEIENMIQHKFKLPKEGIPPEYANAYTDYQIPSVLVYNQFKDDNPDVRLDPPQEISRVPTPPEVNAAFIGADQTTQSILGTYDAALGINKNELSGIAIQEAATQSNAAAMPFIVGYLDGLNQVAQIIIDLIPKYYVTPRTIPVLDKDGNRKFQQVNDSGQPSMQYDPNALSVSVEAGVNFGIQKSRALQQITGLIQVSPILNQVLTSTPEGVKLILENLEMRGSDKLGEAVEMYFQKQAQQPQQPDPQMMKVMTEQQRIQQDAMNEERNAQLKAAQIAVQDKQADTARMKAMGDLGVKVNEQDIKTAQVHAENLRSAVDMGIKAADMSHQHKKDILNMTRDSGEVPS